MSKKNQKKDEGINKGKTKETKSKKIEQEIKKDIENKNVKTSKYHTYLCYLVLFSLIGLVVEVIVSIIEMKINNKEFRLLLGPLCLCYGLGATLTIICLKQFKGKKLKLFLLGTILGGTIQYVVSFILESIFGARLWNCSWSNFNLNNRTCIELALIYGIISILIINVIQPEIDKWISKINGIARKAIDIILTIIILLEITLTTWGTITYVIRAKETLDGKNYTSNNNIIEKFQNTVFSNDIMEKILPRLEIVDNEGNIILIKNINK